MCVFPLSVNGILTVHGSQNMFRRLRTKFQRAESRVAKNDSVESKK